MNVMPFRRRVGWGVTGTHGATEQSRRSLPRHVIATGSRQSARKQRGGSRELAPGSQLSTVFPSNTINPTTEESSLNALFETTSVVPRPTVLALRSQRFRDTERAL